MVLSCSAAPRDEPLAALGSESAGMEVVEDGRGARTLESDGKEPPEKLPNTLSRSGREEERFRMKMEDVRRKAVSGAAPAVGVGGIVELKALEVVAQSSEQNRPVAAFTSSPQNEQRVN